MSMFKKVGHGMSSSLKLNISKLLKRCGSAESLRLELV